MDIDIAIEPECRFRKDFCKLQDVLGVFNDKVGYLISKQNTEYVQAYEQHMFSVQRELHTLRIKATAIANDKTKEQKLKKLVVECQWYRNEALRLDRMTLALRKTLKDLRSIVTQKESERDWLVAQLRTVKKRYEALQMQFQTNSPKNPTNDSVGSLEATMINLDEQPKRTRNSKPPKDDHALLEILYGVHRRLPRSASDKFGSIAQRSSVPPAPQTLEHSVVLSEMLQLRACRDELHDFISGASSWAWRHRSTRAEGQLASLLRSSDCSEPSPQLVEELLTRPETYQALLQSRSSSALSRSPRCPAAGAESMQLDPDILTLLGLLGQRASKPASGNHSVPNSSPKFPIVLPT